MTDDSKKIGIIGGGIAGLTLGCTLLKEGIPTIIFEKSSETASHGAAISISSNALRLLDRLGIFDSLKKQSFIHHKAIIQSPKKPICEFRSPMVLTTRRQTLMALLLQQYQSLGGEVLFNHSYQEFNPSRCEITFKNKEQYVVSHLVACDGIRSSIRDEFFTPKHQPKYSGYSAWRGIGKSNLQSIHFSLGPNSHVVNYPINKQGDVSFVAVTKEEYEFKESWREEGTLNELLEDFALYDPKIFPEMDESMKLYKWGIYIRPSLKSMVSQNITLVGDAAHPIVPFLGQGGCLALEDAYAFGQLIVSSNEDLKNTQSAYEDLRLQRIHKIKSLSERQGRLNHIQNPILAMGRNMVIKYLPTIGMHSVRKVWNYDIDNALSKIKQ